MPICVTVVILCMLISVFLSFMTAVNIVRQTKRNARVVLDSYVMKTSIEIYGSLKNGSDFLDALDEEEYISAFSSYNSLDLSGEMLYGLDEDGNEQYRVSKPTLTFTEEKELKIQAEFTVVIPMYFSGIKVSEAQIPVTVKSKFKEKF